MNVWSTKESAIRLELIKSFTKFIQEIHSDRDDNPDSKLIRAMGDVIIFLTDELMKTARELDVMNKKYELEEERLSEALALLNKHDIDYDDAMKKAEKNCAARLYKEEQ